MLFIGIIRLQIELNMYFFLKLYCCEKFRRTKFVITTITIITVILMITIIIIIIIIIMKII